MVACRPGLQLAAAGRSERCGWAGLARWLCLPAPLLPLLMVTLLLQARHLHTPPPHIACPLLYPLRRRHAIIVSPETECDLGRQTFEQVRMSGSDAHAPFSCG